MICTFYSYKGGVGRSMALANAADSLAREGFRVLMIDFDLEAPGLEHYFPIDHEEVRAHEGLFDLIRHYKAAMASSLPTGQQAQEFRRLQDLFIVPIYPKLPSGGKLDLMPAGCRGSEDQLSEYALGLRQFDWQDFYFNFGGEVFFEWLRRSLNLTLYDVVLVDSRTGVTEMGGICAYQLADIMVVMCASNQQNLDGTLGVVKNLLSPRVQALRAGRELKLLVVPSRVETRDETLLTDFRDRFDSMFSDYLPKELADTGITYWDLMIPYEPRNAFQEKVIIRGNQASNGSVVHPSIQKLVRAIGLLTAQAEPVHRVRSPNPKTAVAPQYDVTTRVAGADVFLVSAATDAQAVGLIANHLRRSGFEAFIHDPKRLNLDEALMTVERRALDQSEVCTIIVGPSGDYPWRNEYLRGLLEEKDRTKGLRFVPLLLPGALLPPSDVVPPFLAGLQWLRLTELGNDTELSRVVEGITSGSKAARTIAQRVISGSPYKGLVPYEEADASIFIGRLDLVNRVVEKLKDTGFLMLIGPSGSGKTSLVRAGVIPALRSGVIPGSDRWCYAFMRLGSNPIHEFFDCLVAVTPGAASVGSNETLDSMTLESFLLRDTQNRYLVVIDQIEEFFTLFPGRSEEGNEFIDLLMTIASNWKSRITLILVMRSDYLSRALESTPILWKLIQNKIEFVDPMSLQELRRAIEAPAQSMGFAIEPGLVELILKDAAGEPGALPLVQYLLLALWERRRAGYLTVEAYHELGGVTGLVAREAERFFSGLGPTDQEKVKAILLRLVTFSPEGHLIGRRATLDELISCGSYDDTRSVIDRLADARLVVVSSERESIWVQVVHESLLGAWHRLKDWAAENRVFLAWQQWLEVAVKQYEENKRNSDLLLRGFPLTEAVEWLNKKPDYFSPDERRFVTASQAQVTASQAQKIRSRMVTAAIVGLFLVMIGGSTAWLWKEEVTVQYATSIVLARLHLVSVTEPGMVKLPGGTYQQGSSSDGAEQPVRQVTIKPFAIGRNEVTFAEYDRYVELSGSILPSDENWGRGKRPVINVSWKDAEAYAKWLSQATGKHYRLPTESEWEYAARSGGMVEIWAGTSDEKQLADFSVYNVMNTEIVGSKKPNGIGLYDMSGNVEEWTKDCRHDTYQGAPTDGLAWLEAGNGECGLRVIRGGAWNQLLPEYLRTSFRNWSYAVDRTNVVGIRLVQDIP